ncbi:MAG: ABC transporter ATP-binding protein [Lawsonella sp.]
MQKQTPLLEVENLDIAFGSTKDPKPTVHGASFQIYPGETVAIVGESGSGKSTTAHAIIDLLPGTGHVTGGSIKFHNVKQNPEEFTELVGASSKTMQDLRGKEIGLVPQDPMTNLNPVWTIGTQISEALKANNVTHGRKDTHTRACELLAEAGMKNPESHLKQYPHEFSGGMCQRALIAIGLHARPKLLIADEPTSALDVTVQKQILDHLEGLIGELDTAVLLITHDLGLAAERAERIIVMQNGRIVEQGPSLEILRNPQHPYTKQLIKAAPSLSVRRADQRNPHHTTGRTLLKVENLTKRFLTPDSRPWKKKYFTAVDDVSLEIKQLQTTAIVGESGSGKSTVANMMLGLLDPTEGAVFYEDEPIKGMRRREELEFRRKVQPVFQNPYGTLDPMWSVFNLIQEPLKVHKIGDKQSRRARVLDIMDRVALPRSMARRYPMELSGGQRQRVAIARALVLEPEVVICDEAVSALDVLVQAQILDLLNELQEELGLTYVFITHDLAVVKQIADEVVVMQNGRIVERGETDELYANPQSDYTAKLLDAIPGADLL